MFKNFILTYIINTMLYYIYNKFFKKEKEIDREKFTNDLADAIIRACGSNASSITITKNGITTKIK